MADSSDAVRNAVRKFDVLRYAERDAGAETRSAIDRIFFASSNTKSFASEAARAAFRERWLGRYLTHFSPCCFVAADAGGGVIGYLVGSLEDPARDAAFADIAHFQTFSHLTARYPAQLHVNVDEDWRGHGIGAALVAAFVAHARSSAVPGVHIVTSRGARNVRFYERNGFREFDAAMAGGHELVFLGRSLD
jgi:GNAT superfamily N-acetyltransferase